jgi:diguanylate cyclase (GGDEF)-like protein
MDRLQNALTADARDAGLLYVDLDRFKTVNDDFGHERGDAVLVEAARRMTSCIRGGDTLARVGGDEFVIILDGAAEHAADEIAERILAQLRLPFDLGGGVAIELSASIGISVGRPGDSPADVLNRADLASLTAKRSGRDVSIFDGPGDPVAVPG